jgi:RNA polymerase sigma-70 factor (ECF subfamily)
LADISDKIIAGCRRGDGHSQEELYRLLAPGMYGLCLKYAGDRDEAKDILQEGFIKVFRKIDQYGGKGSFEGWVRRIMINTALEKFRNNSVLYPLEERMNSIEENDAGNVVDQLSAEDLLALVQQLTPQYRMVFNLYAIEGYTHKEISGMMGITEGTSKSNLSRARTILQEKIRELYMLPGEKKKNAR